MIILLDTPEKPASHRCSEALFACTDWDAAEFRYPNPIPSKRYDWATACNIRQTGKKIISLNGACWLRGQVEWVGDGEPSTFCKCLILCDWNGNIDKTEAVPSNSYAVRNA